MLLQVPEEELAVWEEKVKQTGKPLEQVVFQHIQELKHKGEESHAV
jgi:hypothetical protein